MQEKNQYGKFGKLKSFLYIYIDITKYFIKVVLWRKHFLRTPLKFGVLIFYLYICIIIVKTNIMKAIEDNWGSFPRTETCTQCKSKVELESIRDCTYRPYSGGLSFERKEVFIWEWECPCCHEKNFIYVYV